MKRRRKGIADDPKDEAMIHFNGSIQDFVVARQQPWHLLRMFLRQFRAALDIGKKESNRAGRESYTSSLND